MSDYRPVWKSPHCGDEEKSIDMGSVHSLEYDQDEGLVKIAHYNIPREEYSLDWDKEIIFPEKELGILKNAVDTAVKWMGVAKKNNIVEYEKEIPNLTLHVTMEKRPRSVISLDDIYPFEQSKGICTFKFQCKDFREFGRNEIAHILELSLPGDKTFSLIYDEELEDLAHALSNIDVIFNPDALFN
jgi:hypothetical protein